MNDGDRTAGRPAPAGRPGRPLVGLVACTEHVDGVPHQAVRDAYVRALSDVAGCRVVVLPVSGDAAGYCDHLDGIVLGGHQSNVAPQRYGGAATPGETYQPPRDTFALELVPAAVDAGVPLLGICRGLQEMNVALGGTLRTLAPPADGSPGHREDLSLPRDEQYLPLHDIEIRPGGVLHAALAALRVGVNSLHGQAVDALSPRLRTEAVSPDGVVEAASVRDRPGFALGVQWHPEWHATTDPVSRGLFAAFGAACRRYTGRRHAGRTDDHSGWTSPRDGSSRDGSPRDGRRPAADAAPAPAPAER